MYYGTSYGVLGLSQGERAFLVPVRVDNNFLLDATFAGGVEGGLSHRSQRTESIFISPPTLSNSVIVRRWRAVDRARFGESPSPRSH